MGTSLIAFIVVLGVLVFFHELGHFLIARLCGVGVEVFSLGFGPRIFGKTVGLTDYRISAIPLGGYVKMVGEEPDAELDPEMQPLSFTHKPVLQRIAIVAAGPLSNVVLAIVIFLMLFLSTGIYVLEPIVGSVENGSPAEMAGVRPGDRIVAINEYSLESWDDMRDLIAESKGSTLSFQVLREGELRSLQISPSLRTTTDLLGEEVDRYVIGITASGDRYSRELSVISAVKESFVQTWWVAELTVITVAKVIQGRVSAKNIGGPIMIAKLAGQQAEAGIANLAFFIALISINLAIINILPIPVLDGGHLLFFTIEAVIGRPVHIRIREVAQQVGLFILLMLMILVFYNDLTQLVFN